MALGVVDRDVRRPLAAVERELVEADRQRPAGLLRLAADRLGHFVNRPLIQLDRRQAEPRIAKREPQCLDRVAGAVHGDRMIVRIDRLDVIGECPNAFGAEVELQVVLLAQVPLQGQVVAEAGDHLAVVQLSLGAQLAVVELALVGLLGLVEHEVQKDSQPLGVVEDDFPLPQLGDVEVQVVVRRCSPCGSIGPIQGQTSLPSPPTFIVRK